MVIDKTGIMEIFRNSEEELKQNKDKDGIFITTRFNDFSPKEQIGNDSIDLRISNTGYIISNDYEYINTLSGENFEKYFVPVTLNLEKGYDLNPGDVLFIDTLERIHLVGDLIGRITGRSVFSRFGLSVHCTQDKFSSGINSIAALQIVNNSNTVLKIFPYQKLAQLIIQKTSHNQNPYSGTFSLEESYKLPRIKPEDRIQYDKRTQSIISELKPKKLTLFKKKKRSVGFYSFIQAISGGILGVATAVVMAFFNDNRTLSIIASLFFLLFYILESIVLFLVSKEKD